MPTIQEEMSKVLSEWEKPTSEPQPTETNTMTAPKTTHPFNVTNNITRVTFDYVKNHAGTTATQAATALVQRGYKHSSVTSLMAQMTRQGMMRKEGFKYYVTQAEYTPIKAKRVAKATKKEITGGIATLPKVKPVQAPRVEAKQTVQEMIDKLTLREARELYNELYKYFGDE